MPERVSEAEIRAFLDRDAIRELPVLYCHYVWQNDPDAMVSLFTEDCVFDDHRAGSWCTGTGRVVGRSQLLEAYRRSMGDEPSKPHIHNHVVKLEGANRATGTCYVDLRMPHRPGVEPLIGYYDDVYAKEDGRWLFAERTVTLLSDLTGVVPAPRME